MSDAVRLLLLHGVLRRWSHSRHAGVLVLRGGLMTQLWVGPQRRTTNDIDFLALFPRDLNEVQARLDEILSMPVADDGVSFDLATLRGAVIWQETAYAGLRFLLSSSVADQTLDLQIDVGFGDPLVPPPEWVEYPTLTEPVRVQAIRPELLVAWKLDGLFDRGAKRWQSKDLFDLYLLTSHCQLDEETLAESIRVAFEAHADPLDSIPGVLYSRAWWQTDVARRKWTKFREAASVPVPEDVVAVAAAVARALRPTLERLLPLPDAEP